MLSLQERNKHATTSTNPVGATARGPLAHTPARKHREFKPSERQLHDEIKNIVRKRCPDSLRHKQEDLAQKASLRLWESSQNKESPSYCRAYLYRIVTSVIVNEIRLSRSLKRECSTVSYDKNGRVLDKVPTDTPNPELQLLNRSEGASIVFCMEQLEANRKTAVTLSLQGYRAAEIGTMLKWNTKRAENLIARGRNQLRKCLRNRGVRYGNK